MYNVVKRVKRLLVFSIVLAMVMANTIAFAATSDITISSDAIVPEEDMYEYPLGTSITYDMENQEILYGIDQKSEDLLSGKDSYNLEENETMALNEDVADDECISGVLGEDTRKKVENTLDSPYRNICYIDATFPDGVTLRGSGTLIYFSAVITAGHVVYSHNHGGWATKVEVIPAMKYIAGDYKNAPLGSANARRMTTNTSWIQNKEWDWAIVDLNKNFQTWQLFANGNRTAGRQVKSIGYPCDKPNCMMYYDVNVIKSSSDRSLNVLCDTSRGDSGGAIIDTETGRLIGIMSDIHRTFGKPDYEISVRINQDLYERMVKHQQELKEETGV